MSLGQFSLSKKKKTKNIYKFFFLLEKEKTFEKKLFRGIICILKFVEKKFKQRKTYTKSEQQFLKEKKNIRKHH